MQARIVASERLDLLPPDDPLALRSRRDLRRVHLAMGTRGIVARGWRTLLPEASMSTPATPVSRSAHAPVRVLELGAGDGTLALAVARRVASDWPVVHLTLLDRQDIVSAETRSGFDTLGWSMTVERIDVHDWARTADAERVSRSAPGASSGPTDAPTTNAAAIAPAWDLITTTLFLHHFEREALAGLLAAVACRSRAFFACEPRRGQFALLGSRLVGLIGANEVTREDAVLSVRAGFRDGELSALWPGTSDGWSTRESSARPFGHTFSARRTGRHR